MITQEQIEEIDQISKDIYKETQLAFSELETIKMVCFNIRIQVARLGDTEEARALSKTSEIITSSINKVEDMTRGGRDASKQLGKIINTIKGE